MRSVIDDQATKTMHQAMPFTATLGVKVMECTPALVRSRLPWHESLTTSGNIMHGGALMALADANGGMCAFLNLPAGARTSTIESKTNFLRAVRSGYANAVSKPLHVGRRVIVVETELTDDEGRLVAKVTQSQIVLT
jgi:uncharacterized protein (TIGR00369 family)